MSGIGVIIIILQLAQLVGHKPASGTVTAIQRISEDFEMVNTAALGMATIALIYAVPQLTKAMPNTLVALIVVTIAMLLLTILLALGPLAEQIPARHIDTALDVRMAEQRRIHDQIDFADLRRIGTDQVRRELGDAGAHPGPVGRQVERPERANLAVTGAAVVRLDLDDRAVEDLDILAFRPGITAFLDRQIDLIDVDCGDLHGFLPFT